MARLYANNCSSTLAGSISDSATSLTLATGDGAKFPSPSGGDYFDFTLEQGTTREIARCTARSGDVLTITRAVEAIAGVGAVAQAFTAGAIVAIRTTAASLSGGAVPVSAFGMFSQTAGSYARGIGTTDVGNLGFPNASNNGTATARSLANTIFGAQPRVGFVSAAAINSSAGRFFSGQANTTATEANAPALLIRAAFGISDATYQSTASMFVGIAPGSTVADPAGLTSVPVLGIGCSPADTTLSVYHGNGGGTVTKVSLGSNFPANTTITDWFDIELLRQAGSWSWAYRIRNATTGQSASGTVTTNVPNTTIGHNVHIGRNTLAGTAAVGIDWSYIVCANGSGISF